MRPGAAGCCAPPRTRRGARGCTRVYVSSFTFQAPAFYQRHGYAEFARTEGIPHPGHADVHMRKDLTT